MRYIHILAYFSIYRLKNCLYRYENLQHFSFRTLNIYLEVKCEKSQINPKTHRNRHKKQLQQVRLLLKNVQDIQNSDVTDCFYTIYLCTMYPCV
jgi:hypothetical protein